MASERQLSLWRESAGRAGADMALTVIMSWYEDISLDILRNLRTGSRWVEDPTFVALRQARAFQLVEYADVHTWNEGPSFLPDPDQDVVAEGLSDDDSGENDSAASDSSSSSSDSNGDARSSSKGTGHSTARTDAPEQPRTSEVAPGSAEGEATSVEVPPTSGCPAPEQVAASPTNNA